jgi:hypothetical protein
MMREAGKLALVLALALVGDLASERVQLRGIGLVWFVFTACVFALGVRWALRGFAPGRAPSTRPQFIAPSMVIATAVLYGIFGHLLRTSGQEALLISIESAAIALLAGLGGLAITR